jgi:hypothetical protein
MVLTQIEFASILKNLKIAYSGDVIEACRTSKIENPQIAEKWFKAAFYVAAQDNRSILTAQDVNRALTEMFR